MRRGELPEAGTPARRTVGKLWEVEQSMLYSGGFGDPVALGGGFEIFCAWAQILPDS
jgi:hypothetical protein